MRLSLRVSSQWTPFRYSLSVLKLASHNFRTPTHDLPASSASRFARTARSALFSERTPKLSFTVPLLSKNVMSWLSCFFPNWLSQVGISMCYIYIIPCWAKSENVPEVDGERLRGPGALPEGRLSRGRKGWGAVTTGRDGKLGLDREVLKVVPLCSEYGVVLVDIGCGGAAAAAALWSLKTHSRWLQKITTSVLTSTSWHFFRYARFSFGNVFSA